MNVRLRLDCVPPIAGPKREGIAVSRSFTFSVLAAAGLVLTGCGGGGSGSSGNVTSPPPSSGSISGDAIKGPVNGGTITAYAMNNGAVGAEIAHVTTDANGHFSLSMGSHAGPVMLQLDGGTYTDESTGVVMTMLPGDVMTAVVPDMTAGQAVSGVRVTPLTTMAQAMAQRLSGGMTGANVTTANAAVGVYFSVGDILHDMPIDPLMAGSGTSGADQDSINYGMTLAAMSEYAEMQGMSSSSAMVTAMVNDAEDGTMNGRMFGDSVMMGGTGMGMPLAAMAGTGGLATAMAAFTRSAQNHSGVALATMQPLIDKLNGSTGQMMNGGPGNVANGKVSGTVFNGAMHAGMVTAYAVTGGAQGPRIAGTPVDSDGHFTMSLGPYAGPLMLRFTAGAFDDEATGTPMQMGDDDMMTAVLSGIDSGADIQGICITALTSMAQARANAMNGGMNASNVAAANGAVGHYFMVNDVLATQPVDMSRPGSGSVGGVTRDQINYGAAIAAMSQYAHSLGMSTSSAFVTAMVLDASDGTMNGRKNGSQIQMGHMMGGGMMGGAGNMMSPAAGTSGLATSMTDFMDSAMNHSGLTSADVNPLVQQLAGSSGAI